MIKRILAVATAVLLSSAVFAQETKYFLGGGLATPINSWDIDGESEKETGFAFDVTFLSVWSSNLVTKAELLIGTSVFEDFDGGFLFYGGGGVGYAFVNNEKSVVAVLGNFKYGFSTFSDSYSYLGIAKVDIEGLLGALQLGVSLESSYSITDHLAIYGGLELDYAIGTANTTVKTKIEGMGSSSDSDDTSATAIMFTPKIGVAYKF